LNLEHVASELDKWHPGTRRYMHGTNDLNMALRDTLGPYCPSGIGPMAICHLFLENSIN
jgi:hypothetical protein